MAAADKIAIMAKGRMEWIESSEGMTADEFREIYAEHAVEGVG